MNSESDEPSALLVLLVTDDQQWKHALQIALMPLGDTDVARDEKTARECIRENLGTHRDYAIVLIDITTVGEHYSSLIAQIRKEQNQAKIVVASAIPSWREAKEVFLAGAIDYVRKTMDREQLRNVFRAIAEKKVAAEHHVRRG